jgi:hypothetical protein
MTEMTKFERVVKDLLQKKGYQECNNGYVNVVCTHSSGGAIDIIADTKITITTIAQF